MARKITMNGQSRKSVAVFLSDRTVIARRGAQPPDVAISSGIFCKTYRRLPRRFAPRNDMQVVS